MSALVLLASSVFIQFFSTSLPVLVAGTLLVGVSLGSYGVLSLTYAMVISPLPLRGVLGAFYSFGVITGPLLTATVTQGVVMAGVDAEISFLWSLGAGLGALLGAFISLWILAKCLRRPVYIWGQLINTGLLFIIGFIQLDPKYYERHNSVFAQGALMVIWNIFYGAVLSPVSTVIMGEVPSNALRPKTVAFASAVQVIMLVLVLTIYPYLLNPDSRHLQGYIRFIAGASSLAYTIWTFFSVPETSLAIETLDMLFMSEVKAHHFTTFEMNRLEGTTDLS
ncbi:hypothetical protein NW759_011497 [Fusarium solani]|nr:hypothetical protein NW759_011497 [Fusarium solani]